MEESSQRRLNCLFRHFSLPMDVYCDLHLSSVNGGKGKYEEAEAVVIGGMVLDIHATPSIPPNPRTTCPGKVKYELGGVARNIAECMSKLGTNPYMISCLGTDMAGNLLLDYWISSGLSTEGIRKHSEIRTPVITNVFDTHGEVLAGVADVEAVEKFLTPQWILQFEHFITSASVLLVDANLSLKALEASCQVARKHKIPVWFEPVSVLKSTRIVSVADSVTFASPNEDELIAMANALSGADIFHQIKRKDSENSSTESLFRNLKPAILVLLEKGIETVVVTVGVNGIFLCSKDPKTMTMSLQTVKRQAFGEQLYDAIASSCSSRNFLGGLQIKGSCDIFAVHFPAVPASVVRLTGAGDCLVGGTLASLCSGLDLMQSVAVGIAAAKCAVEAETNVPSAFSLASIADDARLAYSSAKLLVNRSML